MTDESDGFRKARDVSREQLAARYKDLPTNAGMAIPTQWRDGAGGASFAGKPVPIITEASADDIAAYTGARVNVCGHCKYFDLEAGRKEILRQGFAEALVHDYEWQLKHLGAPLDSMALCGASGGSMIISFVSKGCDQFRPR